MGYNGVMPISLKQLTAGSLLAIITAIASLFWVCPMQFTYSGPAMVHISPVCAVSPAPAGAMNTDGGSCADFHASFALALRAILPNISLLFLNILLAITLALTWTLLAVRQNSPRLLLTLLYQKFRRLVVPPAFLLHQKLIRWLSRLAPADFALVA